MNHFARWVQLFHKQHLIGETVKFVPAPLEYRNVLGYIKDGLSNSCRCFMCFPIVDSKATVFRNALV